MFANMAGKNSFSNDSKFALRVESAPGKYPPVIGSDRYPGIEIESTTLTPENLDLIAGTGVDKDYEYKFHFPRSIGNASADEPAYYYYRDRDLHINPKHLNKEGENTEMIIEHELTHAMFGDAHDPKDYTDRFGERYASYNTMHKHLYDMYDERVKRGDKLSKKDMKNYKQLSEIKDLYDFDDTLARKKYPEYTKLAEYAEFEFDETLDEKRNPSIEELGEYVNV